MFKKISLVVFVGMCFAVNVNAGEDPSDTYFYQSVCPDPAGGAMQADKWSFYKCECTSYVAHKLNEDDIPFTNFYKSNKITHHDKKRWSNAGRWKGIAEDIGIATGDIPYPGDVAWWSGHVAYVEKVEYDNNGQWTKVYISEYNYRPAYGHEYGKRDFTPTTADRPQKYLHIKPIDASTLTPQKICGKKQCNIDYHTFSTGEIVGWYPRGHCDQATQWFGLRKNEDGTLEASYCVEQYYPCQCK